MNHPRRIPWSVATPEEVMTEYVGVKLRDYYFNPAVMMDVQLKSSEIMHELYGLPVRKSVGASFTSYICASALGLEVHFPEDNCPQWARHPMGRIDEVDGLAVPKDLTAVGLMPRILANYEYMKRHAPPGVTVHPGGGGAQGPWTTAVVLRGTDIFLDVYEKPAQVHKLLGIITETAIELIHTFDRIAGVTNRMAVGFGDDYGGLLSPPMYWEFSGQYMKRIGDAFSATRRSLHSESLTRAHLKHLADIGITSFDAGTVKGLTITDLKECLSIPFLLQFKTSEDMLLSTPERIQRKYREMVAEGATQMMVELCRRVPRENVRAFVEVAREYD